MFVQFVQATTVRTWPLQEARAHLRDFVDSALEQGPQRIPRHGKQAVIVESEEEWNRRAGSGRSFGDWLVASPLTSEDRPLRRPARAVRQHLFD